MSKRTKSIQYVATLPHVREVSLAGTADLGFWADRLKAENLAPLEVDGRAQILVIAADSWFLKLRFQELSFSVSLSLGGAFLAQAFNSRRFFAFCERTLFGTPYDFADVSVGASLPASIQLNRKQEPLFRAEMGAGAVAEAGSSPDRDGWEGPLFLPSRRPGQSSDRWFFAQIRGATQTVGFQPSRDVLEIRPAKDLPVLQALIDSRFSPTHWLVRPDSMHAKSKTYRRSDITTEAP
jgi:hypothetical protein